MRYKLKYSISTFVGHPHYPLKSPSLKTTGSVCWCYSHNIRNSTAAGLSEQIKWPPYLEGNTTADDCTLTEVLWCEGELLACLKCKWMEWNGSMLLVRFDTEKQLQGPSDKLLLCPLSLSLDHCQAYSQLPLNAPLFSSLTPLLYLNERVWSTAQARITKSTYISSDA